MYTCIICSVSGILSVEDLAQYHHKMSSIEQQYAPPTNLSHNVTPHPPTSNYTPPTMAPPTVPPVSNYTPPTVPPVSNYTPPTMAPTPPTVSNYTPPTMAPTTPPTSYTPPQQPRSLEVHCTLYNISTRLLYNIVT